MGHENMPKSKIIEEMENMLKIAADSTRLKILCCLLDGEEEPVKKSVSKIIEEVGASQSLVSHQLKVLKDSDLVDFEKEGTKCFYYLKDDHVRKLIEVVYDHVQEGR